MCEPSLMFGVGGMLDPQTYPSLDTPGLGLRIRSGTHETASTVGYGANGKPPKNTYAAANVTRMLNA